MKVPKARKLDSGKWAIQMRLDGQSVYLTAATERECIHKAELVKAEYLNGQKIKELLSYNPTLRSGIDLYIERRNNALSPSTVRGYHTIRDYRFQSVADKPMRDVKNWQSVVNTEARLCSEKTLRNAWRLVASVMRDNDMQPPRVVLPQIVESDLPWLEPEQINTFVAALKGEKCEIVALLALHSLRRSEIMALTWDKVDLENGTIRVEGAAVIGPDNKLTQKKTNKNTTSRRLIPIMIPELAAALAEAKAAKIADDEKAKRHGIDRPPIDKQLIVTCNANTPAHQINRICAANNLPEVGVHGLRRSFASLAYHLGMSELETMRLGGWADTQTMRKIYTKLSEADRTKAANKMAIFYANAQNAT